jgi:hypothetical protein
LGLELAYLELAYLEQVEAEGLDLSQDPYSADWSRSPVRTVCAPGRRGGIAGNADSTVAPRCPLIRITYRAGAGSMTPWSRAGR